MAQPIIILGSGVSGLLCGLECIKNGMTVVILESEKKGFVHPGWITTIDRAVFLRHMERSPYPGELATETNQNHIVSPRGTKTFILKDEKLYHLHFTVFYDNLRREFLENGGKIFYNIRKLKFEYTPDIGWNIRTGRRFYILPPRRWQTPLVVDASGPKSKLRGEYSLEKLKPDPNWQVRAQYGEYKVPADSDWKKPQAGERYSIVLRHNSYSLQQYHYDAKHGILKTHMGVIRQKKGALPVSTMSLKNEIFQHLRIPSSTTVTESFRDIPIRHSALALASDGYIMIGDTAFLRDSQRASGISSALVSANLAAKTITYIHRNNISYNYHNLHAYTHEYMMTRGIKLLQVHALTRLSMNFDRNELDLLFQKGFVGLSNIENLFEPEKSMSGTSYFFKKLLPILKNLKFSVKISKHLRPYFEFRKHLKTYPYFPTKDELLVFSAKTAELLDKIYDPEE